MRRERRRSISIYALRTAGVLLFALHGCCFILPRAAWGQASDQPWEVMPVLIPEEPELQRQFIPRSYIPIEIEDLAAKLQEELERRRDEPFRKATLAEAFYVAKIDNGLMVADQVRWRFRGGPQTQPINLGTLSVALQDARSMDGTRFDQLSSYQSFLPDGSLVLRVEEALVDRWLGLTISAIAAEESAIATDEGEQFLLQLPAATVATMLVSSRANERLHSEQVVVEAVERPSDVLPNDWPRGSIRDTALAANRRWWKVNLSGCQEFTLKLEKMLQADLVPYQHSVRTADIDYEVGAQQVDVRATWQLADVSQGAPLRIRMDQAMRIKSMLVDGVEVDWRSRMAESGGEQLLEIVDQPKLAPGAVLQLIAVAEHPRTAEFSLPLVHFARAWCIEGRAAVRAVPGISLDSVKCEGILCVPDMSGPEAQASSGSIAWNHRWSGSSPVLQVLMTQVQPGWQAEVLNRINVQSDWISANCRIRLQSSHLRSNELHLRVDPRWFIDSVQWISDAEVDYRAELIENNSDGGLRSEIVISWEQERSSIQLELEVTAHRPREDELTGIALERPQVVALEQDGDSVVHQTDTYVVESSGRIRVQPTAALLRFQRLARQLPDWQQTLLPQLMDAWIFRDEYGALPTIQLAASGGTYSIELYTLLSERSAEESGASSIVYRMTCRPVSGSVDRVKLQVPVNVSLEDLSFDLLEPIDDSLVPLACEEIETSDSYRELQLYLPTTRNNPFRIRGRLRRKAEMPTARIATMAFPDATSVQSTLVLRERQASFAGNPQIEVLPANACCSLEEGWIFQEELQGAEPEDFAVARLDGGEATVLELLPLPHRATPGWIWSTTVDRYRWDDSSSKNIVRWDVETADSSEFKFVLPEDWRVDRIQINGERTDQALRLAEIENDVPINAERDGQVYELTLSPNRRTEVELTCIVGTKPGWTPVVDRLTLELPRVLGLPVFNSNYRLHLGPSNIALTSSVIERGAESANNRLLDRLLPSAWWQMLAPQTTRRTAAASGLEPAGQWNVVNWPTQELGMARVELVSGSRRNLPGVWIMHRSALAACVTSLVAVLTTLFWLTFSMSPRGWWLLSLMSLVTCILLPREWVPWAQLLLLAASLSALLRLATWIIGSRFATSRGQGARVVARRSSFVGLGGGILCLASLAISEQRTYAQPPRPTVVAPSSTSLAETARQLPGQEAAIKSEQEVAPVLYGVLFPVDKDSRISGAYAYVPTRLWDLLSMNDRNRSENSTPHLLSASYLLRLRRGSVNAELSVDLRVQADFENGELRLPFRMDQLQLRGGQINGEERLVGLPGLRQESDYVALQTGKVGTSQVTLQFVTTNTDSRLRLRASIPPVPNATLRVESEGLQVDVQAVGDVQSSGSGEVLANLGPIRELDVNWRERSPRGFNSQAELASETWVHVNGDQVMAACQLRFSAKQEVRPILHVYIDSDWEPVGTRWGDAELVPNETMSFGNRRVYTVRMPKSRITSGGNLDAGPLSEQAAAVIRVLLVPANAANSKAVNVPFMLLQEQSATSRYLSWSVGSEVSPWKVDGVEFWQEALDAASDWGELVLSPQRRNFKVPLGTTPLQIRQQNAAAAPTFDERTSLHYSLADVRVDYSANWEPRGVPASLRLQLPRGSRVTSLAVNGQSVDYRVSRHKDGQWLLIPASGFRSVEGNLLELSITLPPTLEQSTRLPRVIMHGVPIGGSRLFVYRGNRIDFQLDAQASAELLSREISTPTALLLDSLEVMVGEFELGSSFRDGPELPFSATIRKLQIAEPEYALLRLKPRVDGWIADVVAVWNPQAPIDFVFFDVPSSTRNILQADSVARKFMPAADASRATLCIVPSTSSTGQRVVRFSFPISKSGSGQSLLVPRVQLLADSPQSLWLVLPRQLDGTAIEWTKAGNRLASADLERIAEPGIEDYVVFSSALSSPQIAWESSAKEASRPLIVQKLVRVLKVDGNRTTAVIGLWILPRGELELEIALPDACQVLGVDLGGRSALWHQIPAAQHDVQRLKVSLKPNYLPINLQLLVEWPHAAQDGELSELELPVPRADLANDEWLVSMAGESDWRLAAPRGQALLLQARSSALLPTWFNLVRETSQGQGVKGSDIPLWLSYWDPQQAGLSYEQVLDRNQLSSVDTAWDGDSDGLVTVAEFWTSLGGGATPGVKPQAVVPSSEEPLFILRQARLAFVPTTIRESLIPRLAAASLLILAAGLGWSLSRRIGQRYLTMLAENPWLHWLQLAALSAVVLPALWPSILLLGMAALLASGNWLNARAKLQRSWNR